MAATDRDLVLALRAELAAIDPSRECDRDAEREGLELAGRTRRDRRDPAFSRLAVRLARRDTGAPGSGTFDWATRPDHCRMAWLRGRFLAAGSLSIANGRTHLELLVAPGEAEALGRQLAEAGMPPSWRVRRGKGVVTWKSSETVGVVLRRIGAGASLLELEARQVARSLRGELNRVLNAESANLARTVAASFRQLEAISDLERDGRLAKESFRVREVAAARRETPEATIGELAERLSLHRSAVQRALERIERLARA